MPKDTNMPKEVVIRGVRKVGWINIVSIVLIAILLVLMLFFILNNHYQWVEVLPW